MTGGQRHIAGLASGLDAWRSPSEAAEHGAAAAGLEPLASGTPTSRLVPGLLDDDSAERR